MRHFFEILERLRKPRLKRKDTVSVSNYEYQHLFYDLSYLSFCLLISHRQF